MVNWPHHHAGVSFPVIHHFLSAHIPASERSRALGAVFFGNQVGTIVAFYVYVMTVAVGGIVEMSE